MRRQDLLAHSASNEDSDPQAYEEHVANVRRRARRNAEAMLRFATSPPDGLVDAIEAAAAFHDLGKLDEENQAALRQGRATRLAWDHVDAGVAHLSANKNWMAAWLVRAHHAPGLPSRRRHFDPDGLGRKLRGRRWDDTEPADHQRQIERTDAQLGNYLAAHESAVGNIEISQRKAIGGLTMRLALSCLVDADHADTARFNAGLELPAAPEPRWQERLRRLDAYVRDLPLGGSEERNRQREAFYQVCRNADIADSVVACEGPVGIGKTTAVAAYLIKRAHKENLRRLIIVAPYTNIITQTVERLRRALTLGGEMPDKVVVEHHHRADFESLETRELAVLWQAPVVVTTAVQFFETLASHLPECLRKLHAVPGSAIFVDEAHAALPAQLWPQNWQWVRELAEGWGCRFVFASGSLARFWENRDIVDQPIQLAELFTPELKQSVLKVERQRICYKQAGLFADVEALIRQVCSTQGPRLVILNTVQSAAVVGRAMRERGQEILHLSTALAPKDRAPIVAQVNERLNAPEKDWTLVATSCVEAGVDFSFRTAFRERFSTASLVQVGGRVNRHGEGATGTVYDFLIDEGKGITRHPAARFPAAVLDRQFKRASLSNDGYDPAALVTAAMAEEIRDRGGLDHDALSESERQRNYPAVAKCGRVIDVDTRLVVVDPALRDRLIARDRVPFRALLSGSVQIWSSSIDRLGLEPSAGREDVYWFPYAYDPLFLGYMAGLLELKDFEHRGFVIA